MFRNEFLVISMYDSESGGLSGIWILYDFGLQHLMLRNLPSLSLMFPPKIDVSTVLREAFAHQNFTVVFDTGSGNLIVETQVLIVSETSLGATDSSRPALIITLIVIFFDLVTRSLARIVQVMRQAQWSFAACLVFMLTK